MSFAIRNCYFVLSQSIMAQNTMQVTPRIAALAMEAAQIIPPMSPSDSPQTKMAGGGWLCEVVECWVEILCQVSQQTDRTLLLHNVP